MKEWLGLPVAASEHGGEIDFLLLLTIGLMAVIFLGWLIFFSIALIRFRAGRGHAANPKGARGHTTYYLEIGVAAAEALLLVAFSIPFWREYAAASPPPEGGDPVEVRVVAQQFVWNIHYAGEDGVYGARKVELIDDETNPLGLDPDDPAGGDDIVTRNQLHLPVGRPALIRLTAKDVVHSFSLPEFRVKRDVIPGMETRVQFTPVMTTEEFRTREGEPERNFEIVCAQLCGLGHYRMRGFVTIHTEDGYNAWLQEQAAEAEEEYDPFWD